MSYRMFSLHQLGWRPELAASLTLADFEAGYPARVIAEHDGLLSVYSSRGCHALAWPEGDAVPGDWLLLDRSRDKVMARLPRQSLYHHPSHDRPAGVTSVANIGTLCLVASCAADLNDEALARCVARAKEANVTPLLVLVSETMRVDASVAMVVARRRYPGVSAVSVVLGDQRSCGPLLSWMKEGGALFVAALPHDEVSIRGAHWLETALTKPWERPHRVMSSPAWTVVGGSHTDDVEAKAARPNRVPNRETMLTHS